LQARRFSDNDRKVELFPSRIDNTYRGSAVVVGFFVFIAALTLVRSGIHIIAPDGGAQSIATIPLGSFSADASDAVIHLFALWGLSQLIVGVIYIVAILRYRSLIPLLLLLALVEYTVRLLLTWFKPMKTLGTAPGAIGNYVLIPLLLILFVLSLIPKKTPAA
jgi:hypothetical protein